MAPVNVCISQSRNFIIQIKNIEPNKLLKILGFLQLERYFRALTTVVN